MLRVVALLLAAATACGKDTDGECRNTVHCGLTRLAGELDAFNTENANKAQETLSDVVGEAVGAIVVDAARDLLPDSSSTPATQSTITCKYEKKAKVRPCKEGDIVVDTTNGVLCTFIKYKTKWPWAECRNPHDRVLSYRAGQLRHATDGEKIVNKDAVKAYKLYKEKGGEEPSLPKVAKFPDEGSAPDPAAVKKNTEVMRGLLKNGGWTGGTSGGASSSASLDGDDLQVTLAFDAALSEKCIDGRARKFKHADLKGSSPAKKSAFFAAQNGLLKEWREDVAAESDCKKKDGLMSDEERRRRAQAKALEEQDQQELESKKTTQINLDRHGLDENGNYVARVKGAHAITGEPSFQRVTPGTYLDLSKDTNGFLTETLLECAGGRAGILEKSPKVLEFLFSYDQLDARAILQYFDSNKGTGKGDSGHLSRLGTNSDLKSRDIFQIGANVAVEVHNEYGRFDPPILDDDEPHVVAKKTISKGFLGLRDVGMVEWDDVKKTWYNGGKLFTCISAANHRRADEWETAAAAAKEAGNYGGAGSYVVSANYRRSPDAIPADGAVAVGLLVMYLKFGGEMKENVYCLFGVDATTHAASGKSVRDFVMSEKLKNIKWRNDYFEECKKSGKCVVHFQFRGPHGSQESADEFYTKIYKVRLDEWVFEGEGAARRILKAEHRGLLHMFEAAASTVPGPTEGRVNVDNVRHFLSLDEAHASVYCANDYRMSNDNMESWHGLFPGPWPENAGKMRVISYV